MNMHKTFDEGKGHKKSPSLGGVGNIMPIFDDPNNAPPNIDPAYTSIERRQSLLFDTFPAGSSNLIQSDIRPLRTRADTYSHSSSRPFALSNEITVSETQSNPSPIQRRPTVSGVEFSTRTPPNHNRTHSLNINTGLVDNFGPSLFTNVWDRFGTSNHSPFSGLISSDSKDNRTTARISAVETVASAIEFLGIDDSNNLQLINDPFNVFSAPPPEQFRPMSRGRFRSNSSAVVTSPKLGVAPLVTRNRSFSIPEREVRAAFESMDIMESEVRHNIRLMISRLILTLHPRLSVLSPWKSHHRKHRLDHCGSAI